MAAQKLLIPSERIKGMTRVVRTSIHRLSTGTDVINNSGVPISTVTFTFSPWTEFLKYKFLFPYCSKLIARVR